MQNVKSLINLNEQLACVVAPSCFDLAQHERSYNTFTRLVKPQMLFLG